MEDVTKKLKSFGILLSVCAVIVVIHAMILRHIASPCAGDAAKGYAVTQKTVIEPRLMRLTAVIMDVEKIGGRLALAATPDTVLTPPLKLAKLGGLEIAMNANPWYNLPAKPGEAVPLNYIAGNPVTISGWAYGNGRLYSAAQKPRWTFFVVREDDGALTPHISMMTLEAPPTRDLVLMVTGYDPVLRDGKILKESGGALHPRSVIGFTPDRKQIVMMTVDGRQPGYSVGADEHDLGILMQGLGCSDALNLDGGGSTVLILDGRILNSPSEDRPIPLMIGVKKNESL